jgi:hypothetical protein
MTATTDPARNQRAHTTGTTRSPAPSPPQLHNGDGDRRAPCAASAGTNGHALRLLNLTRRAEQAQANQPAAARGTSDRTPDTHAPAPQPPVALILDRAADLIADHGWCQGQAADLNGSCLEHAVYLCGYQAGASTEALDALIDGVDRKLGMPARVWNDTPGRTPGEVIALLLSCAEEARTA